MTIEERAIAYRDDVRNGKHGTNNTITDAYYVGATEQKQIDDEEMSDALFIQRIMFVEKACNAFCANCEVGQAVCKEQRIRCPQFQEFCKVLEE